uniref:Uncharacterized protein n=1 Tax=viral metagenome TaxID=1070528 RepID=A0A6M3X6H9_9ZZZZ
MTALQQAIEKGALTIEHLAAGITLVEPNDHILELQCEDAVIASYSATGVKASVINKAATEQLERNKNAWR